MKRIFNFILSLTTIVGSVNAQNFSVQPVEVQAGGQTQVVVSLTGGTTTTALQFNLKLPEGLTVNTNSTTLGAATNGHTLSVETLDSGELLFVLYSMGLNTFNDGVLLSIPVTAGNNAVNDIGQINTVRTASISGNDVVSQTCTGVSFDVTIEPDTRTVLSDEETTPPAEAENVDVRVVRSIAADNWSTICLPFAMSAAQVQTAFGENVQLGDFTSWSAEKAGNATVGINVGFTAVTAIEANHPYIIKVTAPVTEFTVDGVNIVVADNPTKQVGTEESERGYMHGIYTATTVPEKNLFLNANKFYYSVGNSPIKAFRAYFEFYDVLDSYNDATDARITLSFEDNATKVKGVRNMEKSDEVIYNLSGQRVSKVGRGVYVKNGKKVVNN